jgi:hypothetical protein
MACDICGSHNGEIVIPENAQFRKIRIACWEHYFLIEEIRMSEAQAAWRYGKKDWYERLRRNVITRLKPLYRTALSCKKLKRNKRFMRGTK